MYQKIYNPNTKKKVTIHSKIGKMILYKYLTQIGSGQLMPTETQVSTPESVIESITLPDFTYVFNNRSRNIIDIYGVNGIHYYKFHTKFGIKKIILISDEHIPIEEKISPNYNNAISIDEFIVDITQTCSNLDKCVDFYLERALTENQGNPLLGGMYQSDIPDPSLSVTSLRYIRNIFADCSMNTINDYCIVNRCINKSTYEPTQTILNNLRLHNIDLRQRYNDRGEILSISDDVPSSPAMNFMNLLFYIHILEFNLGMPEHKSRQEIVDMCLDENYRQPRRSTLPPDDPNWNAFARQINKYLIIIELIKKKIEKEQRKFNLNNVFEIKQLNLNYYIHKFWITELMMKANDTRMKWMFINTSLVDLYTMLRMLKNFEIEGYKSTRGPQKCKDKNSYLQNNIIVFAGLNHVNCYRNVLDTIVGKNSCIYSQLNEYEKTKKRTSKILKIDKGQIGKFQNFNELMIDFCDEPLTVSQ